MVAGVSRPMEFLVADDPPPTHRKGPSEDRRETPRGRAPVPPLSDEDALPDGELIARARRGETEAFRHLVGRHSKKAYWTAYNILRAHEDSQDVAQEAFIRVYRFMDRYDPAQKFTTWLYQIVVNLSIDAMRRRRGHARLENVPDAASDRPGPSQEVERDERRERVREVLASLPDQYRIILALRDIEGLPSREVAAILQMNHATVRWRLHRARSLFKETWELRYGEDGAA